MRYVTCLLRVAALKASNFRALQRKPTGGQSISPKGQEGTTKKKKRLRAELSLVATTGRQAAPQLSFIVLRERGVGGRFQKIPFLRCNLLWPHCCTLFARLDSERISPERPGFRTDRQNGDTAGDRVSKRVLGVSLPGRSHYEAITHNGVAIE